MLYGLSWNEKKKVSLLQNGKEPQMKKLTLNHFVLIMFWGNLKKNRNLEHRLKLSDADIISIYWKGTILVEMKVEQEP
jgi:hypothetical protein